MDNFLELTSNRHFIKMISCIIKLKFRVEFKIDEMSLCVIITFFSYETVGGP